MWLLILSLDAPFFHILLFLWMSFSSTTSPPTPPILPPSSPPRVVLVLGKWEPDVAYCAEVSNGGLVGALGGARWGQSAPVRQMWLLFLRLADRPSVVSPTDQEQGGFPGRYDDDGGAGRRMSIAPLQSLYGGSDSATLVQKTASWPGCSWGTLGSMFDKTTQPEHFELCMTVWELALQAAIICVCCCLDSKPCGFLGSWDICLLFMQVN